MLFLQAADQFFNDTVLLFLPLIRKMCGHCIGVLKNDTRRFLRPRMPRDALCMESLQRLLDHEIQ